MHSRILSSIIALVLVFTLAGCNMLNKEDQAAAEGHEPHEEEYDEYGFGEEEGIEDLLVSGPKPAVDTYRPIEVVMPDQTVMKGTLYIPHIEPYDPELEEDDEDYDEEDDESPATVTPAKVQYPLVVFLHMLSDDRWSWRKFPVDMMNSGYAVLALDLRGHGESIYRGESLRVWRQFSSPDWKKLAPDVGHVLDYIAKKPDFNMVNTYQVAMVGASIGANVSLNYGADASHRVKGIVLLSPGLEYHGIETFEPLTHYENAVFYIASGEDEYAAKSVERLYKFTLGKKKLKVYQNLGHGTDILFKDPKLPKDIIRWVQSVIPPVGVTPLVEQERQAKEKEAKGKGGKTKKQGKRAARHKEPPKNSPAKTAKKPVQAKDPKKAASH